MGVILAPRDLPGSIRTLRDDFSSFDRCMQRSLCKIPFIVVCVVGGLILLTLIMCCVRCVLCGYACCSCCCGGCCGSSNRRSRRGEKHSSHDPPPTVVQQQPVVIHQPIIQQPPMVAEQPQYAYFDSKGADSLPHMPALQSERVVVESHEMKDVPRLGPSNPYDMHPTPAISRAPSPNPSSHYEYGQQHQEPSFHQPQPTYRSALVHPHTEASQRMYGNEYNSYHQSEPQHGPDSHYGYGQKKPEPWTVV